MNTSTFSVIYIHASATHVAIFRYVKCEGRVNEIIEIKLRNCQNQSTDIKNENRKTLSLTL